MSDAVRPPRPGEELPTDALAAWLAAHLPGMTSGPAAPRPPLEVLQYPAGHSNLTYRVHLPEGWGDLPEGLRHLVVRRPPFGVEVKSAHDMGREHQLIAALHGHLPVPRPIGYEPDPAVLGAPFYVMAEVEGTIIRKSLGRPAAPEVHTRLSRQLVETLAALHGVDWRALGLGALYRGEGYARRQVEGWARRWQAAVTEPVPAMDELSAVLLADVPADHGAALVHNDLKYDNLVYDDGLERVLAILDWEMATIGCPWMDLGTTLGYWTEATDPQALKLFAMGPTWERGALTRAELVLAYGELTGLPVARPVYYFVFGLFKIAVVGQQIYRRFVEGKTRDPRFGALIHAVRALAELGRRALERDRLSDLG